jgi:hypothetical protein
MSAPPGPGEYIPPRRMDEGDPVRFYDLSISEERERGRVEAIDHASDLQLASIRIYSDERLEENVPFEQPDRGYVYDAEIQDGGELGG